MGCCGQKTDNSNIKAEVIKPITTNKVVSSLEVLQSIKVTRTSNDSKGTDKKDS